MKIRDIAQVRWNEHPGNPVIEPPVLSPVIADPTFIEPAESPDGMWHLYAHSVWGIHHFVSRDGIAWEKREIVARNAMRPYLYRENDLYYLFYERFRPLHIFFSWLPFPKWKSRIEVRVSGDLKHWSAPVVAVTPSLEWHSDDRYGSSIGNPCLVKEGNRYHLYYSASLVRVDDCGFNEPKYIGVAISDNITGPYRHHPEPLIGPEPRDRWRNLGAGSIKVLRAEDGFAGFLNGIYFNEATKHSGSAISVLESRDGLAWKYLPGGPVKTPTEGWQRSHVYACDVKFVPGLGEWRLYYNARDDWHWTDGTERIGLLTGTGPVKKVKAVKTKKKRTKK